MAQVVAELLATQAQVDWAVLLQASVVLMALVAVVVAVVVGTPILLMRVALVAVLESWDKELAVLVEVVALEMVVVVALAALLAALMAVLVAHMAVVVVEVFGINLEVAQLLAHQVALAQ